MVSGWHRVFIINRTLIKLISYIIPCSNVFFSWPLGAQPHFMVLHHQETPAATRRMQHGGAIPIACL